MDCNFIFFHIDTKSGELSDLHANIERESIVYFINSISGVIEITILSLLYHIIKKKINAKL